MTNREIHILYESILSDVNKIIKQHINEAVIDIKFPEFNKKEFIKEFGLWVKSFKIKSLPEKPVEPHMKKQKEIIERPRKPMVSLASKPELPSVLKTISNRDEFLKHMSELYGDYFKRFLWTYRRDEDLGVNGSWQFKLSNTDDSKEIYDICKTVFQDVLDNISNITSAKERKQILETLGKYVEILRKIVEEPNEAHKILSEKALQRDAKIISKYNEKVRDYKERIRKYGKPLSDEYLKKKEEYDAAIIEYEKQVNAAKDDTTGYASEDAYERAMEKYELALDKWEDAKKKFGPDRKISISDFLLIKYIYAETGEEIINTKFGKYKVPSWIRGLKTSQMVFQDKSFEHRDSYTKFLEMNPKISIRTSDGIRANSRTGWTLKKFIISWVINYYMGEDIL